MLKDEVVAKFCVRAQQTQERLAGAAVNLHGIDRWGYRAHLRQALGYCGFFQDGQTALEIGQENPMPGFRWFDCPYHNHFQALHVLGIPMPYENW